MALQVNWITRVITIPKTHLTLVSGALYTLDTYQFKKDIDNLMDDEAGMANPDIIRHNTVVYLSGIAYSRIIEIINGYTITFEDGSYTVSLIGSNNNIADVKNVNQVSLITNNSAGLIDNTIDGIDTYAPTWDSIIGINTAIQVTDSIQISSGSASDNNEVSYRIYIATDPQLLFTNASLLTRLPTGSTAIRTEADGFTLLTNKTYYLGVTAIDAKGNETDNTNYLSVTYVSEDKGVLTTEQHDKLMETVSFSDLIVASNI